MTTSTRPSTTPAENWSLDRLGKYVAETARKQAEQIWWMGTALNIAHAKCDHGAWQEWCGQYVPFLSRTTIWRMRRVAELPFEEVAGAKVGDVYKRLQSGAPVLPESEPTTTPVTDPTPQEEIAGQDADTDDRDELARLEDKVSEVVEQWPHAVEVVQEALALLSDALDLPALDAADAIKVLIDAMSRQNA